MLDVLESSSQRYYITLRIKHKDAEVLELNFGSSK